MTMFYKLYTSGRNAYRETTRRALHISGSGHFEETIVDIMGRDISGKQTDTLGNDILGK